MRTLHASMRNFVSGGAYVNANYRIFNQNRRMGQNRGRLAINSLTGRSVGIYSAVPQEAEVLFAPGTKFKVLKVTVIPKSTETQFDLEELAMK